MTNNRSDSFRYWFWLKGLVFWHRSLLDNLAKLCSVKPRAKWRDARPMMDVWSHHLDVSAVHTNGGNQVG
jgi:hypothetical protein